jgi:ABC-type polysaccharide/polyol phosphate export permease
LLIATLNVFFRDTEHILSVGLLAWFFLTPVFYPLDMQSGALPGGWQWLSFLNPMTGLVCAYRAVLMAEALPAGWGLALSCGLSWLVLFAGIACFSRLQGRFADVL